MSGTNLTPPTGQSPGEAKPRAVSGSLKDRIAKFNNPSAAPLVPTHAFGTAGPTAPSSTAGRGLIGNRIPSLDPRTAGLVGGQRKVSENRGLIGNRIPSQPGVPGVGSAGSAGGRSSSPAGSVDSSSASGRQPGSSASAHTSRSSSPPTSLGGGVPPSLLAATLPETGGPGAMTPSSTRADAGEDVTDFSPPATPNANPELPPSDDDLVRSDLTQNNLPANAIAANPMFKNLQQGSTPSITSSMASQYDSKGSGDQTQMLLDVSGVSTPTGTPRAAHRDLEGSLAGSARGEGSVADADDLTTRLEGVNVRDEGKSGEEGMAVDRDPTPEPPKADEEGVVNDEQREDVAMKDDSDPAQEDAPKNEQGRSDPAQDQDTKDEQRPAEAENVSATLEGDTAKHNPRGVLEDPDAKIENTTRNDETSKQGKRHVSSTSDERDPNEDDDLDALKQGKLHHAKSASRDGEPEAGNHTAEQNPVNNLVEASLSQDVAEHQLDVDETKHQGGVAGQHMEDVDNADQVIQPEDTKSASQDDGGPDIREATPVAREEDEPLGPKGSLDGPQKFSVEWIEEGRGQSKAADLDGEEYHFGGHVAKHDESKEEGQGDSHAGDTTRVKDEKLAEAEEESASAPVKEAKQADVEGEDKEVLQSQEDKATVLPDAPSTEPTTSSKPTQIHIEPAPIAQPAESADSSSHISTSDVLDTSDEPTPSAEPANPPSFPAPPSDDPDVVDPISQTPTPSRSGDQSESGVSTPIDPSFVRSFPEVPDEQKPRVEVHVSSPMTTPKKDQPSTASESAEGQEEVDENGTPLADLPGASKSLSYPDLSRSESGLSESEGGDRHMTPEGLNKRLSARRSPKSPLLGDEDPGDFTPGEGWAVVTKGRDL